VYYFEDLSLSKIKEIEQTPEGKKALGNSTGIRFYNKTPKKYEKFI